MAEPGIPEHPSDPDHRLVFRRGKLRPRENDEVRMMRDALTSLHDLPRVKGILLELGRFYNPVTNASVVEPDLRRRVVSLLEQGEAAAARALLEAHLAEYQKMDERPSRPE